MFEFNEIYRIFFFCLNFVQILNKKILNIDNVFNIRKKILKVVIIQKKNLKRNRESNEHSNFNLNSNSNRNQLKFKNFKNSKFQQQFQQFHLSNN